MLIYFEIWIQSLSIGVRFVLRNVLSSKFNIVQGEGGYRLHLRDDSLSRPLKGRQSTFAAIFRCDPTTFGNDYRSKIFARAHHDFKDCDLMISFNTDNNSSYSLNEKSFTLGKTSIFAKHLTAGGHGGTMPP